VLLVPMISVTVYTLITLSLTTCGRLRGCCRQLVTDPPCPVVVAGR